MNPFERVDAGRLAKGAGSAATVLIVGGLCQPLVLSWLPPLGVVWLIVTAVAAFAVAAWRANRLDDGRDDAALHGALAALFGYVIVLPLVVTATRTLDPSQVGLTVAVAVVVGSATGWLIGRRV